MQDAAPGQPFETLMECADLLQLKGSAGGVGQVFAHQARVACIVLDEEHLAFRVGRGGFHFRAELQCGRSGRIFNLELGLNLNDEVVCTEANEGKEGSRSSGPSSRRGAPLDPVVADRDQSPVAAGAKRERALNLPVCWNERSRCESRTARGPGHSPGSVHRTRCPEAPLGRVLLRPAPQLTPPSAAPSGSAAPAPPPCRTSPPWPPSRGRSRNL